MTPYKIPVLHFGIFHMVIKAHYAQLQPNVMAWWL